jgi:hypothetical protein
MTFVDFITHRIQSKRVSHLSTNKLCRSKNSRQQHEQKQMDSSVPNIAHRYVCVRVEVMSIDHVSYSSSSSIMKVSTLAQAVSSKTVTFASVFDIEHIDSLAVGIHVLIHH